MAISDKDLRILLGVGFVGAVVLFLHSRTDAGRAQIAGAVDTVSETAGKIVSGVRGIRNNNPGNIRKSGDAWQGLDSDQSDPAFFRFASMEYGIRALARIVSNYGSKYGLFSIRQIVSRWAPSVENDTNAYVAAVSDYVGVSPDFALDTTDPDTLFLLVRAIIRQEVGSVPALLVSDSAVNAGVSLSLGYSP